MGRWFVSRHSLLEEGRLQEGSNLVESSSLVPLLLRRRRRGGKQARDDENDLRPLHRLLVIIPLPKENDRLD